MLRAEDVRIFVATRPVDFRGSFDRLGGFVREHLGADPRSGSLYVFLNKQGTKVKVLFFDRTGDCLVYKRLDQGTFRGIIELDDSKSRVEINPAQLERLLVGVVVSRKRVH